MSPFQKLGKNKYRGPSGKMMSKKQVIAYHASGGYKKKKQKKA